MLYFWAIIQQMIQIKVKGNKKYSRFFIDSIKMELNNSQETIRLLRLKTLPDHKNKHLMKNYAKMQQKHHHTLENQQREDLSYITGQEARRIRIQKWEERDQSKELGYHFKDMRSRMSYNLETIDNINQTEIACSLHQFQGTSSNRETQRQAIINLDKLHSMHSKARTNLRNQSLVPLVNIQKNCKSNDYFSKNNNNSYLIDTPQKVSSLSYKEILLGHGIEHNKIKPIQQIKHRIKESRGLKIIDQRLLDHYFKENQDNAAKLKQKRRENAKKIKPLETNLSPWRTKYQGFVK